MLTSTTCVMGSTMTRPPDLIGPCNRVVWTILRTRLWQSYLLGLSDLLVLYSLEQTKTNIPIVFPSDLTRPQPHKNQRVVNSSYLSKKIVSI